MTKSTNSEQVNNIGQAKHSTSDRLLVGYETVQKTEQNCRILLERGADVPGGISWFMCHESELSLDEI